MIRKEEVQHIAHLARIHLTDEEVEKFQKELSSILEYVEQLRKIDTKDVDPLDTGTFAHSVMREDEVFHDAKQAAEVLREVPMRKDGYVKVKAILRV